MEERNTKATRKIDVRFLYILPSLLALIFAVTSFAYQFGNEIVDLKNTCYTIFLNTPENKTAEEMINELDKSLMNYDISGFWTTALIWYILFVTVPKRAEFFIASTKRFFLKNNRFQIQPETDIRFSCVIGNCCSI